MWDILIDTVIKHSLYFEYENEKKNIFFITYLTEL